MKELITFFKNSIKEQRKKIIFLFIFSASSGYLSTFWAVLIKPAAQKQLYAQVLLVILCAIKLSKQYISELLEYPVISKISMQLKSLIIENTHQEEFKKIKTGNQVSKLNRPNSSIHFLITNLSKISGQIFAIISSITLIFYSNIKIGIYISLFLSIYFMVLKKAIKVNIILRKKAWKSTDKSVHISMNEIKESILIRQKTIETQSQSFFEQENKSWVFYRKKINSYLLIISILMIILVTKVIFDEKNNIELIFLTWNFTTQLKFLQNNLISITSNFSDLKNLFNKKHENQNNYVLSETLSLSDLKIKLGEKTLGPFNLQLNEKVITIKGKNGSGKTSLFLAISNLIPFSGRINSPESLYLSLDSDLIEKNKNLSKGEKSLKLIESASKSNAPLILIDELFDCISPENLEKAITLLKDKQIIIITHNERIFNLGINKFNLENDNLTKT